MEFRVEPLHLGNCSARCPQVIVADGVIETDTPQAFVDFLKSGGAGAKLKRIVFFNSRGGNVVASMVFGHILRELGVAGVVGRFELGRTVRRPMPQRLRLRDDGRRQAGRAARQRGRAASHVDRRERRRRVGLPRQNDAQLRRCADGGRCSNAMRGEWGSILRWWGRRSRCPPTRFTCSPATKCAVGPSRRRSSKRPSGGLHFAAGLAKRAP